MNALYMTESIGFCQFVHYHLEIKKTLVHMQIQGNRSIKHLDQNCEVNGVAFSFHHANIRQKVKKSYHMHLLHFNHFRCHNFKSWMIPKNRKFILNLWIIWIPNLKDKAEIYNCDKHISWTNTTLIEYDIYGSNLNTEVEKVIHQQLRENKKFTTLQF